MRVELWTDGSGVPDGPGGWAFILRAISQGGRVLRELERAGHDFNTTSQRMEIVAVIEGLRAIRRPTLVALFTDSQYVAKAFTERRLTLWSTNGWRSAQRGAVKNIDLWRELLAELQRGLEVRATWVRGHDGTELNERCDRLAGEARQTAIAETLGEQLGLDAAFDHAVALDAGPVSALTGG